QKNQAKELLRICGYGIPSLETALYSTSSSLTLISESTIQPYEKRDSTVHTKEMHLYALPWPSDILLDLGATPVTMRITLSYFIEPGPGEIGWKDRYRYPSHVLRFDLNNHLEGKDEFVSRINRAIPNPNDELDDGQSVADRWRFGSRSRDKGSVH